MTTTDRARGVWFMRDRPGVFWLLCALAVALAHPWVPEATWLMTHLVLLGALTHSAMVWSTHFAATILRSSPALDPRPQQTRRLVLLMAGTATVLVGVPSGAWPLTLLGAVAVSAAVLWHGVQLFRRLRGALPGRFRITVRYYLAAAACLPVGAGFGASMAWGTSEEWHSRLLVAHVATMALGWLGLTMAGTLVTLWPTMLRTRMDDRAERLARQALPALLAGLVATVGAALSGVPLLVAGGLLLYVAALGWWGRALSAPARRRPPREFAPASVAAALVWLVGGLLAAVVALVRTGSLDAVAHLHGRVAAVVAVGFGLQLLTGALSYLVPSVLGGGPSVVRAGQRWLERGALLRLVVVNGGLLACLLPVPSVARVLLSVLVLVALASFVPLMLRGVAAALRARRAAAAAPAGAGAGEPDRAPLLWSSGQLVAGVSALAVALSIGLGYSPGVLGGGSLAGSAAATGETTTVTVVAKDMRFHPARIEVPAGDRLVVRLVNEDDEDVHDLVFANGAGTPRLDPGESARVDVGVVGRSGEAWCSVIGHRRMGMVLRVDVAGSSGLAAAGGSAGTADGHDHDHGDGGADAPVAAEDPAGHGTGDAASPAHDATLPPLTDHRGHRVHRVTLTVREVEQEVAPGVWQRRWTFGGRAPAPTLHGRVGDRFVVTVVNRGSMTHSIDFHAGERAPDRAMVGIPPGGSHVYRFTAERAGIWMYHCSTMPMSSHIAAGMAGAVVIEPPDLPEVDRSYVLVSSEVFLGDSTDRGSASEVDDDAVQAEEPDLVTFNGRAFQYDDAPLRARPGERVRFWVLAAGPNRGVSFHVVGGQFDAAWSEGAWTLPPGTRGGAQVLPLVPAQGGFVELDLDEPGDYPFVSHLMVDAERGAHGVLRVR